MEWVETTGRTVAEALDAALDQLGVDEQDAEVQIVQEPQKGLFGRLRAEARVRARVRPAQPRPKTERRERRRRGDRDGRPRRGTSTAVASGGRGAKGGPSGNGANKGGANKGGSVADHSGDPREKHGAASQSAPDGDASASDESGNRRRRRRRGGSGRAKEQGAAVTDEISEASRPAATDVADLDAQRDAIDEFLRGLLGAFGRPEATVTVKALDDDVLEADVAGEGLGLLVGPKGQTLQAVHELVRSMVQRRFVGEAHARVRVDVAGYRQRRREALERFTKTMADQVVSTGQAVALDPMGASDRKTVHDAVNEIDGVRTVSEGEDPDRRVIIQPV